MNRFFVINKHKLAFAFTVTSVSFLGFGAILFVLAGYKEGFPGFIETIPFLALFGLGFPVIILGIAYIEWKAKDRIRQRFLSTSPYSKLSELGFSEAYFNEATKWYFTQYTLEGIVDGFRVKFEADRAWPRRALFIAIAERNYEIPVDEKTMFKELGKREIGVHPKGLVKSLKRNRDYPATINQLSAELVEFAATIREYGFVPNTNEKV